MSKEVVAQLYRIENGQWECSIPFWWFGRGPTPAAAIAALQRAYERETGRELELVRQSVETQLEMKLC